MAQDVIPVPRLVILPERIVKRLRHPQPAEHEEEADCHEDRVVKINLQQPAVSILSKVQLFKSKPKIKKAKMEV